MACERPPRLREIRWLRDFFIDRAATPPSRGGECPHTEQFGDSFNTFNGRRDLAICGSWTASTVNIVSTQAKQRSEKHTGHVRIYARNQISGRVRAPNGIRQ